jgi:hypothetical protein
LKQIQTSIPDSTKGVNSDEGVLAARRASDPWQGGSMDFSPQLDQLQQRAAKAKQAAQAAASEP